MTRSTPSPQEAPMHQLKPAAIAAMSHHQAREVDGLGPVDAMQQALDRSGISALLDEREELAERVADLEQQLNTVRRVAVAA